MKNSKLIYGALCCLAAMSMIFTSCNKDDGNGKLTPEEKKAAFEAVKGNYTGKLIYAATNPKNPKDLTDTISTSWSILTDSTMKISQIPASVLAENITNADVKAELAKQDPQDINCSISFVSISPITFLINPASPTYTFAYGGKSHKVQMAFYVNNAYSFGALNTKNALQMQIVEGAIYVDDAETQYLNQAIPLVFIMDKKQ